MKKPFALGIAGLFLGWLLFFAGAAESCAGGALPADVPINRDAGRGNWLIVTVQLGSGQELPMVVDTGAGGTLLDESLAPILGKRLGSIVAQHWGQAITNGVYTAPKFSLGGTALLITGDGVICGNVKDLLAGSDQHILGILGMDVLEHYCVQLDFAAGKMRFLDDEHADKSTWGKAFPIVPLNDDDPRPAVAQNLLGLQGPHSLLDSGLLGDGWLMPNYYRSWTNDAVAPTNGAVRWPNGGFGGVKYPMFTLGVKDVESDGIGIDFLARHLVTLDFPNHTLYLQRQSIGPRPDPDLRKAEYEPIADRQPKVTAHVRAVVQELMDGTARADDFTTSAWKRLLAKQKDIQTLKKYVGEIVSLTLVERRSAFGWRRSYRYRIECTQATMLGHFVFRGRNKLASGDMTVVEWKEPFGD